MLWDTSDISNVAMTSSLSRATLTERRRSTKDLAVRNLLMSAVRPISTAMRRLSPGVLTPVVICSENSKHRKLVEQAAAAGVNILCEKPLATTTSDAEAMLYAVDRAGVALMTAFPVRFSPSFVKLKSQVQAGLLGDVLAVFGDEQW